MSLTKFNDPMEPQEDHRPPLCVWCVMSMWNAAAHIVIHNYRETDIDLSDLGEMTGVVFKATSSTPAHHIFAGRPDQFCKFLRHIGPDPLVSIVVNQNRVTGYAEMELFGTKVCPMHLADAYQSFERHGNSFGRRY